MEKEQRPKYVRRTLHYYWQVTKPYHKSVTAILLIVPVGTFIGYLVFSYILSLIIDHLGSYSGSPFEREYLGWLFSLLIVSEATMYICWRVNNVIYIKLLGRALRDLEQQVFGTTMQHSYRFFVSRFGGSIVAQFGRFLKGYESLFDSFIHELYTTACRLFGSVLILLFLAPTIGAALLAWAILFVSSVLWLTYKKMPITRREAAADSRVTAEVADAITNSLNVKIFAHRRYEQTRFDETSQYRYGRRLRSWYANELLRSYQGFIMISFELLVVWLSIKFVTDGTMTVGLVLLSQFYIMRVFGDLWNLSNVINRVERSFSDAAEMTEILDLPFEVQDPANPEEARIKDGAIEFKKVSFRYEEGTREVLTNFSLQISAGEKVGLVGHSGSGKTTLTKLLLRFADIQKGAITIDGQDIARIAQEDLRSQIAYVPQEPILFHRTLMDNIRYGRIDATDKEVKAAAKLAHADEFIKQLPHGYDTLVGERGVKLSGGEKQRVAIARAMLSQAPILLLDEATSALDSKSEGLIADALDKLMKGRTTVVIAHRLSTIRRLDRILVMQKGKLVEEGNHASLLKKQGHYSELWSHQTGGYIAE